MIDKTNAIRTVQERMAGLPVGHALDMRTYKRDRSVVLVRQDGDRDSVLIIENGFAQERFCVPLGKLDKALKKILRREFPRSTKIRLYDLGEFHENKAELQRKKI
ncbi:MAG: hypothetical protein ACNI3A_17140 [Desulfovibrio sp.]|uniref:hypothetical protein n=1 Tax=Desulfovibrio sp. 7SRBS1 TaxID=3378064 RepID=UPI003B3D97FF